MPDIKQIQQLDLNLLKVFERLYQMQNMTRTAEALHLTPSAVSHAVNRLRECLGDPLFVRSQHRMLPTPACQRIAPLLIDNLSRLRQILQQWDQFDAATSQQQFRIGMHDALELWVLPRLTQRLAVLAPHITLASIKVDRQHLARELASGQVDLALDVALPVKSPIKHQPIAQDPFCVLMGSSNPLRDCLTADSYLTAEHICVSQRPVGPSAEDLVLQQQGYHRHIRVRCQSYHAASAMLEDTQTLLTLPQSLAKKLLEKRVVMQPLPIELPPLTTHMYWHEHTEHDESHRWLRGLFDTQLMR